MAPSLTLPFSSLFSAPLRNGLTKPKAVRGAGAKFLNMGEVFGERRVSHLAMDRAPVTPVELNNYSLQPGDLLFARQSLVRSGAGKCVLFQGDSEDVVFESHIIRCRLDQSRCDPAFYFYLFESPSGRALIDSIVEQVAAAGIRGSDLARLTVPFPPLSEQRAIAAVLGALDDKIDLNRRMCQTLEEMARALFKSWFVDFDPVRAKMEGRDPGLPKEIADLFPSRLVDSELGPIPEGWRVATLGELASPRRELAQSEELDERTNYIGLEHMPRRSIALADWSTSEAVESSKFRFAVGDILFGKLRPYFHKVGVAPIDGVCSTDIIVARPTAPEMFGMTVGVMSSDAFVAHTDRNSAGTRMPRTNWSDMSAFTLVAPTRDVAAAHAHVVRSMVERITLATHESRTLAALRDTLLPKLISGELRVTASLGSMQETAT